jgi:energy-coupling factor transporter ATP-binding protein EcfA2
MRFLCKNCWIAHEPPTLLGRCKRCEVNTQIERLDPLGSKMSTASAGPIVCKLHPSEPLDVYCGACRQPVPARTLVGERSVIALLGDTGSGKTSFLWVLSRWLRQPNDAGVFIRQAFGDSDEQMAKAIRGVLDHGRMRATPATDANVRNSAWELTTGPRSTNVIAFHDAAGEVWNDLTDLSRSEYDRFYRYLDLVGSIIFAIDGARVAETLDARGSTQPAAARAHEISIIDAVSRRIRARGERMPAAVVVTKADMLWDRPEWTVFQEASGADGETVGRAARELLMQAGRQALVDVLEETFAPVRFFAVSAFGQPPQSPMSVENIRPVRIQEPLMALLGSAVHRT